jgi:multidrug resistance protein, MATE family
VLSRKGITKQYALLNSFQVKKDYIKLIAKVSGPLVFQHGASILAWFFFYMLVARNASQTGLAVSTTMRTVFAFFGTCFWALAATTNSMVSNIIGQGKKDEVLGLVNKITRLSVTIAFFVCAILNLYPELYLSLFRNDALFIETGVPVLRAVAFAMIILSIGTIWLNAVTGTGNSQMTLWIEILAVVLYCIYVYVVLEVRHMSILWGWMSEVLYWTVLFAFSFLYMKSKKWQKKVI